MVLQKEGEKQREREKEKKKIANLHKTINNKQDLQMKLWQMVLEKEREKQREREYYEINGKKLAPGNYAQVDIGDGFSGRRIRN